MLIQIVITQYFQLLLVARQNSPVICTLLYYCVLRLGHMCLDEFTITIFLGLDAYAQYSKMATRYAVKVPEQLTMEQAASTLWQGFTAHAFARSSYPIKAGDKILVHAAAGGVGSLITQIAKNTGTNKSNFVSLIRPVE